MIALEIAVVGGALQSTLDSANARLNPLGLSPGAIAFDISPTELKAGKSHFEQVYDRALQAALNAKGAFDQASKMSAMLRGQENQSSGYLEAYINQINWGRQIKGVGEASRIYFEKHPSELTLSQSALLAGIVRLVEAAA